jgi:DNA-nicking Smr family endonuclease
MAKKKKTAKLKRLEFNHDPFVNLKGFSVSGPGKKEKSEIAPEPIRSHQEPFGSFAEEMEMLGVKPLETEIDSDETFFAGPSALDDSATEVKALTDEELFFAAVDGFTVRFDDHLPEENLSESKAVPRRMKQLRQGNLTPEASLDLHGCLRAEGVAKLRHFLQDAQHQTWQTLLVITGRGLHSEDGTPILRDEVENFLSGEGKKLIAEWGRAPRVYGGDGALIVFLKKNSV